MRFRRDTSGKVVALDYSNPVVLNITFTRQSEYMRYLPRLRWVGKTGMGLKRKAVKIGS